jgi:hypothetical protein
VVVNFFDLIAGCVHAISWFPTPPPRVAVAHAYLMGHPAAASPPPRLAPRIGMAILSRITAAGAAEPPRLLGMVSDPRTDVAGSALAALGATRDARLVQPLHDIPWPKSHENGDLRLERARTLLRLGDWSVLPIMVEGLRDDRLMTRALCAQALSEATHEKLGYDARAEPEEREAAIGRWQTWLRERGHDKLLIP